MTRKHTHISAQFSLETFQLMGTLSVLNPLMPNSDLKILLCLTPDDFTRQSETPWALKG